MSHISDIVNAVKPETAIELLKKNDTTIFQWYMVKGKNGCIYEMGGTNFKGKLKLIIDLPFFENGLPVTYENGFLKTNFRITYNTHPHHNDGIELDLEKFIKYSKKDLRKLEKTYKEVKVVTYKKITEYKFIK